MIQLRPYQIEARDAVLSQWADGHRKTLLVLPTGCHALGEKLLSSDGTIKRAEDIHEGDSLMGPDGNPRLVLKRHVGKSDLYKISPIKGEPFTVTADHMLTLVRTDKKNSEYADMKVEDWMGLPENKRNLYKLIRTSCIEHFYREEAPRPVDPYFLGILIADGGLTSGVSVTTADKEVKEVLREQAVKYSLKVRELGAGKASTYFLTTGVAGRTRNPLLEDLKALGLAGKGSKDKFIPDSYKYADKDVRLEILAGLIDGDGYSKNNTWDYITKSERLAQDIAFVCRSLGLYAHVKACVKGYDSFTEIYYRLSISGSCDIVPCKIDRRKCSERRQRKNILRTGFTVSYAGNGPYIGFTVDGDNRYLLWDFTITHNCGKTIVFSSVIDEKLRQRGKRALVLAHRDELLAQAESKIKSVCNLDCCLEKAESRAYGSIFPVTLGSIQTLSNDRRLEAYPRDYFSAVVVDEAHHSMSPSYQKVLNHFDKADVLGVTATPDRADKKNLGQFYDSLAYEYTMNQAVAEGYLCPIKAQMIPLKLNISDVRVQNGDFALDDLGHALDRYLPLIAKEMQHYAAGRKTLVFLPLVSTAKKFCSLLRELGMNAEEVDGGSENREEILSDFAEGRTDILCNSMLLTEGWDCPGVDCIVILRPTKNSSLYRQMSGRGTRLCEGKKDLLLLDFLWLTEKHDLCRPSSLLCSDSETAQRVDKMMSSDEAVDLVSAQEKAQRDIVLERESALAKELEEMRHRSRKLVDPLQYAVSLEDEALMNYSPTFVWEMEPPTEKQIQFIVSSGISSERIQNKGQAHMIIERIRRRRDLGLATAKQIRCLERYGFMHVGTWKFTQANDVITRLSSNGWKLPYRFDAKNYIPGGSV